MQRVSLRPFRRLIPSLLAAGLSLLAACQASPNGATGTQPFSLVGLDFKFDWSPDRETLSLASTVFGRLPKYSYSIFPSSGLYLLKSRSGQLDDRFLELTYNGAHSWSPSGEWMLYSPWLSIDGPGMMKAQSGGQRRMLAKDAASSCVSGLGAWSPDSTKLGCVGYPTAKGAPETWHVYTTDLSGKILQSFDTGLANTSPATDPKLGPNQHEIRHLDWFAPQKLLVHEIDDLPVVGTNQSLQGREHFFLVDLGSQRVESLYTRENRYSSEAEVSPDGKTLVFDDFALERPLKVEKPGDSVAEHLTDVPDSRVRTLSLADRSLRDLAAGTHPFWSPDGSRIAYLHQGDLMLMRADGSEQRVLLAKSALTGRELHTLRWTPDGKEIVALAQKPYRAIPLKERSQLEFGMLRIQAGSGVMVETKPDLSQVWRDAGMP